MRFDRYSSQQSLYNALESHWPVQRLDWFTRGFYTMQNIDGDIVMTDLRMGIEASNVFNFLVGTDTGSDIQPVKSELRRFAPDTARMKKIWRRQFDSTVVLSPDKASNRLYPGIPAPAQ